MDIQPIPNGPTSNSLQNLTRMQNAVRHVQCPKQDSIYLDFRCFKDYQLGAVLSMIKTQTEYDYIKHQIPLYETRIDESVAKYFPALRFTEEQISKRLHSKAFAHVVSAWAPMYKFFYTWAEVCSKIMSARFMTDTGNTPITVYLAFPGMEVVKESLPRWAKWLQDCFNYPIIIRPTNLTYAEFGYNKMATADVLVLYDIVHVLRTNDICRLLFAETLDAPYKTIYGMASIDPECASAEDKDIHAKIAASEKMLNLISDFTVISRHLATEDSRVR